MSETYFTRLQETIYQDGLHRLVGCNVEFVVEGTGANLWHTLCALAEEHVRSCTEDQQQVDLNADGRGLVQSFRPFIVALSHQLFIDPRFGRMG